MNDTTIEQPVQPIDGDPALGSTGEADAGDDDLIGAATTTTADGKKMVSVPLDTIVGLRKGNRELSRKVKELEPLAGRVKEVDERLEQASPIINAVLNNPTLRAQAIKASQGTRQTAEHVEQPNDDPDAAALAEEYGFYLADGVTPDVARGQRVLARIAGTARRIAEDTMRPLAGMTLSQQAEQNINRALAMVDDEGVPLATAESIREVQKLLPAHLLSNPQVVDMVINQAIGLDRRMRRTPKAVDEPLYLASAGGRMRQAPAITAEERARIARLGISEKDYLASAQKLDTAVASRRGIVLE